MNKRSLGANKEKLAGACLEKKGYKILEYNYRCRIGEIDIVSKDGEVLCFVEVKYRSTKSYGLPEEAVDRRKQRKICQVSDCYCREKSLQANQPIRYDVVAILGHRYKVIKGAFDYQR